MRSILQPKIRRADRLRYRLMSCYLEGNVLDVGCGLQGLGHYVESDRYLGCDLNGGSVRCVAEALPFASRSFETVVLGEVLEHLTSPFDALAEAARVASARMVITVPNNYSLVRLTRLALGREVEIEPEHVFSFNAWNFARLLERLSFEVAVSFSYPLRLQLFPELPIRSRFGYWLFVIADRRRAAGG